MHFHGLEQGSFLIWNVSGMRQKLQIVKLECFFVQSVAYKTLFYNKPGRVYWPVRHEKCLKVLLAMFFLSFLCLITVFHSLFWSWRIDLYHDRLAKKLCGLILSHISPSSFKANHREDHYLARQWKIKRIYLILKISKIIYFQVFRNFFAIVNICTETT